MSNMKTVTAPTAVTEQLAAFAISTTGLSPRVRDSARATLANALGVMVGGSAEDAYRSAHTTFAPAGLPAQATLWGRSERTSMTVAALLGGIAAHVQDFDDTHLRTVIHPGAPVVPAALAVGEYTGATLGEVIDAVALGVEITLRIGVGLGRTHFDRGWHITGTTGRFGAAAAAGRLLGLSPGQMQMALAIAATEAAGLQAAFGTMTKSFHAGKAAYDGVEAALLASMGFTSAPAGIEGRRGFAPTASTDADTEAIVRDLGISWELESNAFKPYACGIVSHPVIDAGIELRQAGVRPEDVHAVLLRTNPVVLDVMGIADPANGLQSKFSVHHCFAVGLIDGAGGPGQFTDARATNTEIAEFRRRVTVGLDTSIARDECVVEISGAKARRHHVEHATGSKDRPMTIQQLREKIQLLTAPVLGPAKAASFAERALHGTDELPIADLATVANKEA
ncbi:MmgE/PrpD family protein [Actinacidiphila oryziradicis]|uniref:MmgE/PrpD family protein n=1 Tax=Actinacidiphila oryziradicis TaxID=2571141 RepID=A0A4U0SI14_9ACTN|nr:MmgE/PrpD family protein [Actinacidiphila oryziradicis]TJZ99894.1 MmgE/PrpD family protein [Actinacidiphila oryziradicis]